MASITPRLCSILALWLASVLSAASGPLAAQESNSATFRIQVDMVLLNVAVTDGKGNYVTGLKPGDFEIYEDGIIQKIATFAEGNSLPQRVTDFVSGSKQTRLVPPYTTRSDAERAVILEQEPDRPDLLIAGANVFILFDTSNYMYRGFAYAQDSIADFVRLLDGPDKVALYAFSRNVKRMATISSNRQEVMRAVRKTVAGDDVALYNALLVTLRDAANLPGRKMVVVFSNGPDNSSMVAPEYVRELAQAEGIPIYMISTQAAKQDPVSSAVFERISAATGGKAYFAKSWKEQRLTFAAIREDLAHLYALSYYPEPNPNNGWRRITVKLAGEHLRKYNTRTRFGYRPKSAGLPENSDASTGPARNHP
jgi:Ca-activated chloride channel family protein